MHVLASLSCIESCADQASFKAVPRFFLFFPPYAWELSELVLLHITKDAIISTRHTDNIILAICFVYQRGSRHYKSGGANAEEMKSTKVLNPRRCISIAIPRS